jgi:glycerol-3-phosphate acyltransferase PlsY
MSQDLMALLWVLLSGYLIGSLSGSLLLGRWRGVDIRASGSGNAGGTNALRTQGWWFALLVVLIDIGKGVLAVMLLPQWPGASSAALQSWLPVAAGLAAIAGHVWPLYFGFRGGKGMATLAGVAAVLMPGPGMLVLLMWLLLLLMTGYVGLASIAAGVALPLILLLWHWHEMHVFIAGQWPDLTFALLAAVFVVWTHRSNIRRLRQGTEHRFERVRLLHRSRRSQSRGDT